MSRSATRIGGVLLFIALALAGCNKGPAEAALAVAEQRLTASRPGLQGAADADLVALDRSLAEARTALEEGRYTDALRIAQDLPSRIQAATDLAEARRLAPPAVAAVGVDENPTPGETEGVPAPAVNSVGAPAAAGS
jgi:hypothetical protein